MNFELHPRLTPVTTPLGDFPLCRVVLFEERRMPWLMLVPRRPEVGALIDLSPEERAQLMEELAQCGQVLHRLYQPVRLNIADIGNLCPQLHVHLVARFTDDPFWPKVAWSQMPYEPYEAGERAERLEQLVDALKGTPDFLPLWRG
ncbi:HIT family protein [Azospirillum sp. A29]|jgi:diadenosine tetraphosphate (Ap4A) HIT family hydrolase|uniref:HIT family protein n=1 Tax=Azospirillum sp. A29 TaxID=3160606 RepID=UPI00366D3028